MIRQGYRRGTAWMELGEFDRALADYDEMFNLKVSGIAKVFIP
jgi:hypothetical protein